MAPWEEYVAAQAMPADLRPPVRLPTLSRQALQELQAMLVGVISEFETGWERRH